MLLVKEKFMTVRRQLMALMFVLVGCACGGFAEPTSRPSAPEQFMRFVDDGQGGGELQTADVEFVNEEGVRVDLVAAVHIGEKAYYDGLNQDFKQYDAVLYELVSSKDAAPPTTQEVDESTNPITEFQRFLKDSLELDFQLDDIDYAAPNFVHADLDKDTFEKMQAERGESFQSIMLNELIRAMSDPNSIAKNASDDESVADLVNVLTKPDMERQIKVVLARQMGNLDTTAMGLDGPNGSVIVTERNKAALKVLSDELAGGKKKVAIFYGAAHLPDMTKRLEAMGFSVSAVRWNGAWDLKIRANEPSGLQTMVQAIGKWANEDNDK
jgi:hypothetical protein